MSTESGPPENQGKLPRWAGKFLRALRKHGNGSKAAQAAGISLGGAQWHRRHNQEFALAWERVLERRCQTDCVLSVEDAAELVRCSHQTLHRLIAAGRLTAVSIVVADSRGRNRPQTGIDTSELCALFVKRPHEGEPIALPDGSQWYLRPDARQHSGLSNTVLSYWRPKRSTRHPGPALRVRSFYIRWERRRGRPKKVMAWNGEDLEAIAGGLEGESLKRGKGWAAENWRKGKQTEAADFCERLKADLPLAAPEALHKARQEKIKPHSLYPAKTAAGIKTLRVHKGKAAYGWWYLPGQEPKVMRLATDANSAPESNGQSTTPASNISSNISRKKKRRTAYKPDQTLSILRLVKRHRRSGKDLKESLEETAAELGLAFGAVKMSYYRNRDSGE